MQGRKCCLHCPGTWVASQERQEHDCNLPTYIKGNLKLTSLKKYVPGEEERAERLRRSPEKPIPHRPCSVYDRFAIAKKFHAENLQHQPLPDKVDDSVFKNVRYEQRKLDENCVSDKKLNETRTGPSAFKSRHKVKAGLQYAPALGCKTPTTNMDLAICWEAPVDPCYEPPWPTHIDGSDGGPAPAIFTLVQHENGDELTYKSPVKRFEAKFCNVKSRCKCNTMGDYNCNQENNQATCICSEKQNEVRENNNNCNDANDLCNNLDAVHISEYAHKIYKPGKNNPHRRQPIHLRNCSPCQCKGERNRRPRSRSLHSAPVVYQGTKNVKRNGLSTKFTIPRPRTPYARREFCIDTLTPPFSIVQGCRDADYPEHWRLTSVYQQSYKNPRK
ncbi:uncharacterized protein [Chelonus insularis]|uniref:uncharacterized protein n=1 Tax=Chelonus insularis TaxID=460826 RepID=UPI00158B40AA|nr:uncharacterized protein LOC118072458 [Chelonus insularis]